MINKTNYEEFFLLYADGELSVAEEAQVDLFIKNHPELKESFDLISATILPVNEINFSGAASLMRSEHSGQSLEEMMLLHLDEELAENEIKELEQQIAAEESLSNEWSLLSKTKLPEEQVVFEEKELLYRREKGRVISGHFYRLAIAAIFIACCFYFGINYLSNKNVHDVNAGIAVNQPAQQVKTVDENNKISTQPIIDTDLTSVHKQDPIMQQVDQDQQQDQQSPVKQRDKIMAAQRQLVKNDPVTKNPVIVFEPVQKVKFVAKQKEDNTEQQLIANASIQKNKLVIDEDLTPVKNIPANVVAVKNEDEGSNTRILYIDSDKLKDTKAGELYNKVKKLVDKSKKIRTGRSLQIANFEIRI